MSIRLLLAVLLIVACTDLQAQKKGKAIEESGVQSDDYRFQQAIYRQAIKYYDFQVAAGALYHMMELQPEATNLRDTLALLYYNQGNYPQCTFVGEEVLAENPDNRVIREIVAISKRSLGLIKESLAEYETLYAASQDLFHLYQIATLQYSLQRYGECNMSLDQIITAPASAQRSVSINLKGQGQQDIPLRAAAYNMKGVTAIDLNDPPKAREHFSKALELAPEFVLAKNNLTQLDKSPTR